MALEEIILNEDDLKDLKMGKTLEKTVEIRGADWDDYRNVDEIEIFVKFKKIFDESKKNIV